MTREELKRHCEKQIEECERWAKHKGEEPHGKIYEEHKLILELLEQEPCEDTISRADAVRVASGYCHPSNVAKELAKLPPVTPKPNAECSCEQIKWERDMAIAQLKELGYGLGEKPKVGHWVEYTRVLIPEPINRWEQAWYCSECGYGNQECEDGSAWLEWKYCPHCGSVMNEVEG